MTFANGSLWVYGFTDQRGMGSYAVAVNVFMVMNFVCKDNSNKLSNFCENKIRMKRFVFVIPFLGSTKNTGICTKIFFRINMNHSAAG